MLFFRENDSPGGVEVAGEGQGRRGEGRRGGRAAEGEGRAQPPPRVARGGALCAGTSSSDMSVTPVTQILENDSYSLSSNPLEGADAHRYLLWQKVVIIIIASCLSLATVIGNSMVMISFRIDKQLQTISNYFLFSLAVADLAIGLFSMPLFTVYTVFGYWPLGAHVCDTWLALDYLASNASVLNLLIISFDRYFSVTRPLTYRAKRTTYKAGIMIGNRFISPAEGLIGRDLFRCLVLRVLQEMMLPLY